MSGHGDYMGNMAEPPFDENVADALLSGSRPPAASGLEPVADLLRDLQATTMEPPAPPSPALASVLDGGLPVDSTGTVPGQDGRRPPGRAPRWRRVVAPIGLGLTVTAGSLTVAAAADLLPDAAQRAVAAVVNTITPLDLPTPAADTEPATSGPASPGSSPDAPVAGSRNDPNGASPGATPGGASPGRAPGVEGTRPTQGPAAPAGTPLSPPREIGPEPFPDPPGSPSAGAPSVTVPGTAPGDIRSPLPLPAPPTTAGTPTVPTSPSATAPTTTNPPRLPVP